MSDPMLTRGVAGFRAADMRRSAGRPTSRALAAARLANSWVFSNLSQRELRDVVRHSERRTVPDGHVIVSEEATGDEFFVLLSGSAHVHRNGRAVTTLGPGASFGELALLDDGPRTATVSASGAAELLVLRRRVFARLLDDMPSFARKLLAALARRLTEADARDYRAP
jgi:CRP-like cAMP-binding protein